MKGKKTLRQILLLLIVATVIMQFFPIDKSTPKLEEEIDFSHIMNPPSDVTSTLRKACYDCHSYEIEFPWYSNVAPFSWVLKNHIDDGIKHLNFSQWGNYSNGNQKGLLLESIKEIEKSKMPLKSYTLFHKEARLTEEEKATLINWMKQKANELPEDEEFNY